MKAEFGCLGSIGYWLLASMFLAGAVMGDCAVGQEAICAAAKDQAFKTTLLITVGIYLIICLAFVLDARRRHKSNGD